MNMLNDPSMHNDLLKLAEKELNKKIDVTKSFEQNNFDSLDLMMFLSVFEEYYKVKLKQSDYDKIKSFSSLKKYIRK